MQTVINQSTNLLELQIISQNKTKKSRVLKLVNRSMSFIEYGLYIVIFNLLFQWKIDGEFSSNYLYLLILILSLFTILSINRGLFRFQSSYGWVGEFFQLLKIVFYTFMITIGLLFLLKTSITYSRAIMILFFIGMLVISCGVRFLKRAILMWMAYKSIYSKNALIIGAGKMGQSLFGWLDSSKSLGYRVIGYLDDFKEGKEIKGRLSDLGQVIQRYDVDEIFITIPSERSLIHNLLQNIHQYRVKVKIIPELYDLVTSKIAFEQVDAFPFVEVVGNQQSGWHAFTKRSMDIALSLLGLFALSPVYLLLWILVKNNSPGSAVFKQQRIGKDGYHFYIYKFRTMVPNAEEKLKADTELYRKYIENNYKLEPEEDPRITKVGHFLRKTSLDELPQLFNVLKGDMSLVGPRPVVEEELKEYQSRLYDFLSVKPGVTGYWQVSGRSSVGYPERVDIELYYVHNRSLILDIKILLKTVVSVLKRDGAY